MNEQLPVWFSKIFANVYFLQVHNLLPSSLHCDGILRHLRKPVVCACVDALITLCTCATQFQNGAKSSGFVQREEKNKSVNDFFSSSDACSLRFELNTGCLIGGRDNFFFDKR